ncbi:hypothetical protein [Cohnella sp.]|uniref:hypothetical protein n=1 Tax=Cohnella sp. TaxID=1883426 RepID=UPI003563F743
MPLSNDELLQKVKEGLGLGGDYQNHTLLPKVLAARGYMLNAGVTLEQLESDLGIATLTVGANDLWNLTSGEVKFSEAFNLILLPQLMAVSIPEG